MTCCEIGHFIEDEEILYDMPLSSKYSDSYIIKKEFLLCVKLKMHGFPNAQNSVTLFL